MVRWCLKTRFQYWCLIEYPTLETRSFVCGIGQVYIQLVWEHLKVENSQGDIGFDRKILIRGFDEGRRQAFLP